MSAPIMPDRSPVAETSAAPSAPPLATQHPKPSGIPDQPVRRTSRVTARPRPSPYEEEAQAADIRVQLKLMMLSDTTVVVSVLVGMFLLTNAGSMPDGLAEFLAIRVTVKNLALLLLFAGAWPLLCRLTGLYEWRIIRRRSTETTRVILTCALVSMIALAFPLVSATGAFGYGAVPLFWIGSSVAILVLRNVTRMLVPLQEPDRIREALIVGTGPRAQRLEGELRAAGENARFRVVGFIDSVDCRPAQARQQALLGSFEEMESILMHRAPDEVLITLPIKSAYAEIKTVLESCERVGVPARYLADLFEPTKGRASRGGQQPLLVATPPAPEGWRLVAKRAVDVVGASALLIVCAPVLLLSAVAIKLTSKGPIFFTQNRYGFHRRRFTMYKLRTMVLDAEALQSSLEELNEATGPVFKIRDDPRITTVGRVLRRTSIDELPQLFNVLLGDMSLVGPRPLPIRDVHRFTEAALMRRFSIRPGITCFWQIGGRSALDFGEWIRLDLKYIDEWSLWLDLLILFRTIPAVLRGTGAS